MDFLQFQEQMIEELSTRFGKENVLGFWGHQNAKIVSISQAPGAKTLLAQRPFSDMSGEKLRRKWYQITDEEFYNQDNFYITAIGKYFPGKGKNGDLKPSMDIAKVWLTQELTFLHPQLYLVIGTLAAKFFFPKENFSELVFHDQVINGKPTFVLPHPSPLNRRWFKVHPEFEAERLPYIRSVIQNVLREKNGK